MNDISGGLSLADLFQATGLAPQELLVIRHTLKPDGLRTRADAMGPNLLPYVREQGIQNSKVPATPPRFWLNFLATTGRRARFIIAHENHPLPGTAASERDQYRSYSCAGHTASSAAPDAAPIRGTPTLTFARNTARVELVALWRRFLVAPCRNSARKASTYSQYIAAAREQRRIS